MSKRKASKTKQIAIKSLDAAVAYLVENENEALGSDVVEYVGQTVDFTDFERERYEKTGYIRWQSVMHFYTIDLSKAGYLRKHKGVWTLTPEGEEAYKQGMASMLETAIAKYREWKKEQDETISPDNPQELEPSEEPELTSAQRLEAYEREAIAGIKDFVTNFTPYEFQDLCGTLLTAMGYFIPHIAPKGKDGGIDLVAYGDPLGTRPPRIKVQVKHRPEAAVSVDVVRQLVALLNKEGDVGLFITSGRFTSESERYARESHKHVELIDFTRLTNLWQEFYPKMTDEQKDQLPLQAVYFLGDGSKR